jgi:hypothetical protein
MSGAAYVYLGVDADAVPAMDYHAGPWQVGVVLRDR